MEDGINPRGGEITVSELVNKYFQTRPSVKPNTADVRDFVLQILDRTGFGARQISSIKQSDVKKWYITLQTSGKLDGTGYNYGSIQSIRKILKPAYKMAVNDDLVRKNPFDFPVSDAIINNSQTREALTPEQELAYLTFVKADPHFSKYYDALYILFYTGLRISEFAGLTVADVDMENRRITVDHQLLRERDKGYYISDTKTISDKRKIPMSDDVYACFQRLAISRPMPKVAQIIDGKCGFFFLNEKGMPLTGQDWDNRFRSIWDKFSRTSSTQMPKVTPHVCRHTFCTNCVKSGMNPKVLQYLMGHKKVETSWNIYTHTSYEDAENEIRRIASGE